MAFMETSEFELNNVGGGSFDIMPRTPEAREKLAAYCAETFGADECWTAKDGSIQFDEDPFALVEAWDTMTALTRPAHHPINSVAPKAKLAEVVDKVLAAPVTPPQSVEGRLVDPAQDDSAWEFIGQIADLCSKARDMMAERQ